MMSHRLRRFLGLGLASLLPLAASAFAAAPAFNVIHAFDRGTEGYRNYAPLVQDAQGRLYGTNTAGGKNDQGTIFALNADGTGHTVLHHFKVGELKSSFGGVIVGSDGRLYGAASTSANSWGGIFAINRDGTGFTSLRQFAGADGITPKAGLLQGSDGRLYGCNSAGGTNGHGTVFAIQPDGTGFVVLHHFSSALHGREPLGALVQGTDGRLYGTSSEGGTLNGGTIFALNTNGTGFVVLRHLTPATDGSAPYAGVIQGQDGRLYGVCRNGGTANLGTVFAINTDGTGFIVLRSLTNAVASAIWPEGRLVQLADGRLVGTSSRQGNNTLFALAPDGSGFGALAVLDGNNAGQFLRAGLLLAADGRLYGTAQSGGRYDGGTLFRLNTDGTGFSVLRESNERARGISPLGKLVEHNGRLYGTTVQGGFDVAGTSAVANQDSGAGVMFAIDRNGTNYSVLHNFIGSALSHEPRGLVLSSDGRFYGSTDTGGTIGLGGVFGINVDGSGFNALHGYGTFPDHTSGPRANMVRGIDGRLYGMKYDGRIIAINANGGGYTLVRALANGGSEGSGPRFGHGGIISASDGRLYGTTFEGGANGGGTLIGLNTDGTGFLVLRHFTSATDGYWSWAPPVEGSDGRLYGTNSEGGPGGWGTLWFLLKDGTGFTPLSPFNTANGYKPHSSLVEGADGRLYGATSAGGNHGDGTLYGINRDGTGFAVLHHFEREVDGHGGDVYLIRGSDNVLYGVSPSGGPNFESGTLFSLSVAPKPVITSPLTASGVYSEEFRYQITASNGPILDYDALGLPPGWQVSHTTGEVVGTPNVVGPLSIDVAATNAGGIGVATVAITIAKAPAVVSLSNLTHTFDGTPKEATVTTTPSGLTTTVTYNGSSTPPSAVGNYPVAATVVNANYQGSAMGTLVISAPAAPTDVTARLQITRGGFRLNRATGRYAQTITLKNTSAQPIAVPLSLVFDGLSATASLFGAAGVTTAVAPLGSPYVTVSVGADSVLSPDETATVNVEFSNPTNQPITYVSRALAGPGTR